MTDPVPPLRILVADDDEVVGRIVATKLRGLGHEVTVLGDGSQALRRLQGGDVPDVLITDRMMPGMSGTELVRAVRESPELAALPVIMLTAKGQERDVVEGLQAGLDDYVVKPFSAEELAARVHALHARSRRAEG